MGVHGLALVPPVGVEKGISFEVEIGLHGT